MFLQETFVLSEKKRNYRRYADWLLQRNAKSILAEKCLRANLGGGL
jgi:hypothetical protein